MTSKASGKNTITSMEERFAHIGKKYGLTPGQVRQICLKIKELELNERQVNFADTLSVRSKNGLTRCFGSAVLGRPEVIATADSARLKMTVQLGPKSLREIAERLFQLGYIDDRERWLES
jgi:hypothetical protein